MGGEGRGMHPSSMPASAGTVGLTMPMRPSVRKTKAGAPRLKTERVRDRRAPSRHVLLLGARPSRADAGGRLARGILGEGVERLTLIGPLLPAIVAGDNSPVSRVLVRILGG